jgi:hypothetical protein
MNSLSKSLAVMAGVVTFTLLSQAVYGHGMSEADKLAIIEGGNLRYMWLGATHMLSGYDHLLFVFGIIFFLTTFRDIVKYITAFTLGHSVTLIYATFNAIQLNYFLIDAVIGLSVCYIAFANIDGFRKYLNLPSPNMMLMIIGLGLIHGFGLSTRLQELPLSEDSLLLNIISFNVGIELGQVSALAAMLALITLWRKRESFKPFSLVANYGLILAGGLLFLIQLHGYSHGADEKLSVQVTSVQDTAATITPEQSASVPWQDTITISIPARGEIEYKLLIDEGNTLEYTWKTDGARLFYDFHGEPTGGAEGYFESFEKRTDSRAGGELVATFTGTHGWYWDNNSGTEPVTIELKIKGKYLRIDQLEPIPQKL